MSNGIAITKTERKTIALVVMGNILDYYDFLLFAHLGYIITPLFIPNLSSTESHLVSLLLFGLPFVIRPLGGYIFGWISDNYGRHTALTESIKWSAVATLIFAFLPVYEVGGWLCTYLFVFFRFMQGISLGGEYPTAGTYIMERYKDNAGLLSGILCASGTIGSLMAFAFAYLSLQPTAPDWLWRFAFFLGGIFSAVSYYLRRRLASLPKESEEIVPHNNKLYFSNIKSCAITLAIGILVGVTTWIPMTYSNFYLTKILLLPFETGLMATFTALISYVILTPSFGKLSDHYNKIFFMAISAFLAIPLSLAGFWLIAQDHIIIGQIILVIPAASFGAPIHVIMNRLFPQYCKGRYVNFFFMLGLGIGGLAPSISGFVVHTLNWQFFPPIMVSFIAVIAALLFLRIYRKYPSLG